MLAIGHQIKVIGELHRFRNFLKDVNTEALAAFFDVTWLLVCFISNQVKKQKTKTRLLYKRQNITLANHKAGPPSQLSTSYVRPR